MDLYFAAGRNWQCGRAAVQMGFGQPKSAGAGNVTKVQGILTESAAAGYNGVVLSDSKFSRLKEMPPVYFDHVKRVKTLADQLGWKSFLFISA